MVEEVRTCNGCLALDAEVGRMGATGANRRQRLARRNAKTRTDVARVSGPAPQHGNGRRNLEAGGGGLRRRVLRSNASLSGPNRRAQADE